jgi:hypothetical protein
MFGLLDEPNTLLVASQKSYIITKLFIKFIIEILISSIIFCHTQFNLGNLYVLLMVNGATQH